MHAKSHFLNVYGHFKACMYAIRYKNWAHFWARSTTVAILAVMLVALVLLVGRAPAPQCARGSVESMFTACVVR